MSHQTGISATVPPPSSKPQTSSWLFWARPRLVCIFNNKYSRNAPCFPCHGSYQQQDILKYQINNKCKGGQGEKNYHFRSYCWHLVSLERSQGSWSTVSPILAIRIFSLTLLSFSFHLSFLCFIILSLFYCYPLYFFFFSFASLFHINELQHF